MNVCMCETGSSMGAIRRFVRPQLRIWRPGGIDLLVGSCLQVRNSQIAVTGAHSTVWNRCPEDLTEGSAFPVAVSADLYAETAARPRQPG